MGPPGAFGLLCSRYEAQYGPVQDALAKLAVTQREHALMNDHACAKLRKPLNAEEYLNARQISSPINLLDCVMSCGRRQRRAGDVAAPRWRAGARAPCAFAAMANGPTTTSRTRSPTSRAAAMPRRARRRCARVDCYPPTSRCCSPTTTF